MSSRGNHYTKVGNDIQRGASAALEGWLHDPLAWAVPRASIRWETSPLRLGRVTLTGHVGRGSPSLAQPHPPVGPLESHQHLPAELQLELPPPSFMTHVTRVQSHEVFHMELWEPESCVGSPWVTPTVFLDRVQPASSGAVTCRQSTGIYRGVPARSKMYFTLCIC